MSTTPKSNVLPQRSPKLAKVEMETLQRRRAEHFRVLSAITELLPNGADMDGSATGTVRVAELAAQAGVSNKGSGQSTRALAPMAHTLALLER